MSAPRRSPQIAQTAQNGVPGIPAHPGTLTGHSGPRTLRARTARTRLPTLLPLTLTEAQFQGTVIDALHIHGWLVHHSRPVRLPSGRHATPIQGDKGLPDLIAARDRFVLLAELKTQTGRVSCDQAAWLDAAGGHAFVWRPADWNDGAVLDIIANPGRHLRQAAS